MVDGPEPGEPQPTPFPGDAFWRMVESAATSVGLGSPRNIFRIRKARARWEARHEASRNLSRGVTYTHKACPACGRLVERGKAECPYCGANVRWAPGPGLMRSLGLSIPHGSTAMALVAANIALYVITTLATMASPPADPLAAEPDRLSALLGALFSPASPVLYHMGSLDAGAVLAGQVWRLWTYQFLHFGVIHIFFNMMALLSLGPMTEDVYGPWKALVVYWGTGVAAGLTAMGMRLMTAARYFGVDPLGIDPHYLIHVLPATVGASGSIFGLIGVLIGHTIRRRGTQLARMRPVFIQWALYGFVMGFFLHADNAAHLGGLAFGIVLGLIVSDRRSMGASLKVWRLAGVAVVILIVYGFAVAALVSPPQHRRLPGEPEARLEDRVPVCEPGGSASPAIPAVRAVGIVKGRGAAPPTLTVPCATLPACSGGVTHRDGRGMCPPSRASRCPPSARSPFC